MARFHQFHLATSLVVALMLPAALVAQTGIVSGRVVGASGEPLQGASVSASGTARGATVRADGSYSFSLPAGRHELRARLLGYAAAVDSVTVTAGSTTTANFTLQKAATSLEAVAVLGTRGEERTVISAPVPIDVLSTADIQLTGRTETSQIIQAVAPSFNFPRTSIGDGTDQIRPPTLRR